MFARFQKNLSLASRLKITSDVCFSPLPAQYIDMLASYNQMHNEAMVICILNVVAVMCENSTIFRANRFPLPMNLYNIMVARSSYGKSPILDLVRKAIDVVIQHRISKFKSTSKDENDADQVVYFDENTSAGLLSSLRGCTRFLITDEGDVVLKKMGYTLPPPGARDWSTNDCRSQLLTLFDRPHHFVRRLKHETVQVFDAKLNVLGAVSGDLIIASLMRQASGSMADALFERTIVWPLDGDIIPTASCITKINESKYMSFEQYAIVISFISNINIYFDQQANDLMVNWCDDLKKKSALEKSNDHLAAHLGKSVQNAHRFVGFIYIAELAYSISNEYLQKYHYFPSDGKITLDFINCIEQLYVEHLSATSNEEIQHYITLDVVERCRDLITGNIEQYKLLMYLAPEDKYETKSQSSGTLNIKYEPIQESLSKKQKRIIRLQPRMTEIMSRILLFRSVTFTSSSLYADNIIKRSASILGSAIEKLIEMNFVIVVKKGLLSSKWTSVYIKVLPDPLSIDEQMKFECKLGEFGISRLNFESYQDACHEILIEGKGTVSEELIRVLQQPEYMALNLDMDNVLQRRKNFELVGIDDANSLSALTTNTIIQDEPTSHSNTCNTNTIWDAENDLSDLMSQIEEHLSGDSNAKFDEIINHLSNDDSKPESTDLSENRRNNYCDKNLEIGMYESSNDVECFNNVIDLVEKDRLVNSNTIENMMIDDHDQIIQEDILMLENIDSNPESHETISGNKQDSHTAKKHAAAFSSKFSPISHRLRSKK